MTRAARSRVAALAVVRSLGLRDKTRSNTDDAA
jgi:hypothetical protein